MKKTYLIIGSSAAGVSALKTINALSPESEIICVTKDNYLPYNKCHLNSYLANTQGFKDRRKLNILNNKYLELNKNITFMKNTQAVCLKTQDKRVCLSDGQEIYYDKLLIATGSSANKPESYGNLNKIFVLHTLTDFMKLKSFLKKTTIKNITVVGAGINGLETVWALISNNSYLQVNLIESSDNLLGKYLNGDISNWLEKLISAFNVNIFKQDKIKYIVKKNKNYKLELESGISFESEVIIFALGAKPEINLLKDSGIITDFGIVTNKYLEASDKNIFASGDCATVNNKITGEKIINYQWADAVIQGSVAAQNMLGYSKVYEGVYPQVISDLFFGKTFMSFGPTLLSLNLSRIYDKFNQNDKTFYRFFLDHNEHLIGFVLLGQKTNIGILKKAVLENVKFYKITII